MDIKRIIFSQHIKNLQCMECGKDLKKGSEAFRLTWKHDKTIMLCKECLLELGDSIYNMYLAETDFI